MSEVGTWLNTNTYHWSDFGDVKQLSEKKGNRRVYVVLPTLNEEENVGNVVKIIKEELMGKYKLVDDLIVVDSNSTDNTKGEAENAGAKFYLADNFSPMSSYIPKSGKGTNLWASVHLTAAFGQDEGYEVRDDDIISWVDADIDNFHRGFICGPVGALLNHEGAHYAKCFYQRPIKTKVDGETKIQSSGGGRVTELSFRPMVNILAGMKNLDMDFRKLVALMQPLSGEYAGTRELLESIPFYTGYSVETNHLIEIVKSEKFGLETIVQVDADKRIHANQSTLKLFDMSTVILDTLLMEAGLKEKEKVAPGQLREHRIEIYRPHYSVDVTHLEKRVISELELPPLITLKRYRKRRGLPPLEDTK